MAKKEYIFTEHTVEELMNQITIFKKSMSDREFPHQKIKVTFNNEVRIQHNKRKREFHTEILLSFFIYGENHENVAYSTRISPRHGYSVTYDFIKNLKSFQIESPEDIKADTIKKTMSLLGKFHNNLWENIKTELSKDPSLMDSKYYSNFATINISGKFPDYVIHRLKEAIENKEDYRYKTYGKRDLSVETKMGEDGVFRAWYSSEYSGCGNGAYYLLLNPTVAGFREDD